MRSNIQNIMVPHVFFCIHHIRLCADISNTAAFTTMSQIFKTLCQEIPCTKIICCSINVTDNPHCGAFSATL